MINIVKTELEDVLLLSPSVHSDFRGYFFESFHQDVDLAVHPRISCLVSTLLIHDLN